EALTTILDDVFGKQADGRFVYEIVNSTVIITSNEPQAQPQDIVTVKGTVTNAAGEPLIGAGVFVKGTTSGVTTDLDGAYAIEAPASAELVYSY
uniref:carboxypeptidase-like regulatory domain-containing protein n=1 Tax=Klebsiella pneumoniae TaxID=573 RepID=UPI00117A793C